jgi:hypothetical protein
MLWATRGGPPQGTGKVSQLLFGPLQGLHRPAGGMDNVGTGLDLSVAPAALGLFSQKQPQNAFSDN